MIPLKKTPTAPTGATIAVGAQPYASMLKNSPPIMPRMPSHQSGIRVKCVFGLPSGPSLCSCTHFCTLSANGITAFAVIAVVMPSRFCVAPRARPG